MYPVVRHLFNSAKATRAPRLGLGEVHISDHICWPWDLDPWMELNNGRTLTLYDLGRIPLAIRMGLITSLKENKWAVAVAGVSVRYRRRVRAFHRFQMKSSVLGWDNRFVYIQQTMWRKGEALSSSLCRWAFTDENGILSPEVVARSVGWPERSPDLPEYVLAWIEAESQRPWPPKI